MVLHARFAMGDLIDNNAIILFVEARPVGKTWDKFKDKNLNRDAGKKFAAL